VHFASIGFPLVGDPLYGREKLNNFFDHELGLKRQFLHAGEISFTLPGTQKKAIFEAALPNDLQAVLDTLS
jgi:23S rRNA pseudouridine1911/1915/1917 synthase